MKGYRQLRQTIQDKHHLNDPWFDVVLKSSLSYSLRKIEVQGVSICSVVICPEQTTSIPFRLRHDFHYYLTMKVRTNYLF